MASRNETLADLSRRNAKTFAHCMSCKHRQEIPVSVLVERFGGQAAIGTVRMKLAKLLLCRVCGSKRSSWSVSQPPSSGRRIAAQLATPPSENVSTEAQRRFAEAMRRVYSRPLPSGGGSPIFDKGGTKGPASHARFIQEPIGTREDFKRDRARNRSRAQRPK